MSKEKKKPNETEIRAAQKIEECISDIFINNRLIKTIDKCREDFDINPDYFTEVGIDNGTEYLDELLEQLASHWSDNYTNNEITRLERYIFDNFKMDFCEPKSIDRRIFLRIATAMLFGIPKQRIFKCISEILDTDYFPKINDQLQIQINELTTIEDVKHIWREKIMPKQKSYQWEAGDKSIKLFSRVKGKKEYPSRERNEAICKIKQEHPEFTRQQIKDEAERQNFNADFSLNNISIILKKCKERSKKT